MEAVTSPPQKINSQKKNFLKGGVSLKTIRPFPGLSVSENQFDFLLYDPDSFFFQ